MRPIAPLRRNGVSAADCLYALPMTAAANWIVPVAIGSVAVVLLFGLGNMLKGGNPNTSQKLMRLRVVLQFVAIVAIMGALWLKGR
jgi:hypothetical protein